jgi:hypothetical protein
METEQLEITREQLDKFADVSECTSWRKTFETACSLEEDIKNLEEGEEFKIYCKISDSILNVEYDEEMIENDDDDMYMRASKAEARHEFLQEKYEERETEETDNFLEEISDFFNVNALDYVETNNIVEIGLVKYGSNSMLGSRGGNGTIIIKLLK